MLADQLQPEGEDTGGHPAAAGGDDGPGQVHARVLEGGADAGLVLERAVGVEQRGVVHVARAGDVAGGHAGPGLRLGPGEARRAAGVDELLGLAAQVGEDLGLGAQRLLVLPDGEVAVAQGFPAGGEGAPFRLPLGEAAVEDRDVVRAEHLEHEPGPRRAVDRAVVVEHDAAAVAQAEALHPAGELRGGGQGVLGRRARLGQLAQVHEHRAGNVRRLVFRARVAAGVGHVAAGVDDPEIARADFLGKPLGGDQRVHDARSSFAATHNG